MQFFIVAQANAACNLAKFSFGSSIQDVEKKIKAMNAENLPATSGFIETEERHSIVFPGEEICKGDKSFIGAPVEMVFLENKLVEFRLFKFLEYGDRPELVNWAEGVYGEKNNKPKSFYDLEPSQKNGRNFHQLSQNNLTPHLLKILLKLLDVKI